MATEVVMPQMGESITEGTITKWLKKVGDTVERDEMIFEISTDKVDAEIPSPTSGVLLEIRGQEGETLEVGTIVALVGEAGESGASSSNGSQPAESKGLEAEQESAEALKAQVPGIAVENTPVEPPPPAAAPAEVPPTPAAPVAAAGDATEVVMPQMGESITEGTITKWLKQVGDKVDRDEMLFEISTDKVDAEIPSPVAGVLLEIRGQEGQTLEVGTIVALVGAEGATAAAPASSTAPETAKTPPAAAQAETAGRSYDEQRPEAVKTAAQAATVATPNPQSAIRNPQSNGGNATVEELRRTKSSPLVRKIAAEHGIDISRISGTGASGRVTKDDILDFIASGAALTPQQAMATAKSGATLPATTAPITTTQTPPPVAKPQAQPAPQVSAAVGDRVEPMSVMRKKIAQHMTLSKQTSAHVTSVYEIDMTAVAKFREKNKRDFQTRYGTKLTFMPFIFQAVTAALRKFPVVNAQVSGENIIYKGDLNLGMAVALDWGLIVPVIKRADTLSLSGLALTANDLADRARTKKLMPDEVAGGTFTITNPGVFGGLFGTPIINQPQVAILCVGTIEKRPKVLTTPDGDDYIAIRQMAYFALTYDHRIVDGADAEKFLSFLKETLEAGQFAL